MLPCVFFINSQSINYRLGGIIYNLEIKKKSSDLKRILVFIKLRTFHHQITLLVIKQHFLFPHKHYIAVSDQKSDNVIPKSFQKASKVITEESMHIYCKSIYF